MKSQTNNYHGNYVPEESLDSGTYSTFRCVMSSRHVEQEVGLTESDETHLSGR